MTDDLVIAARSTPASSDRGLVHRDIKPSKLVSRLGVQHDYLKVLDFGLVTAQEGPGETLLTGRLVFEGDNPMKVMHQHIAPTPPSQRTAVPIGVELDTVVLACLAKEPHDRPADAVVLRGMDSPVERTQC